jgi:hypothetical protein
MYGLWGETIKGVQSSEDRHSNYLGQLLRLYKSRLNPGPGSTLVFCAAESEKKKFEKKLQGSPHVCGNNYCSSLVQLYKIRVCNTSCNLQLKNYGFVAICKSTSTRKLVPTCTVLLVLVVLVVLVTDTSTNAGTCGNSIKDYY